MSRSPARLRPKDRSGRGTRNERLFPKIAEAEVQSIDQVGNSDPANWRVNERFGRARNNMKASHALSPNCGAVTPHWLPGESGRSLERDLTRPIIHPSQ